MKYLLGPFIVVFVFAGIFAQQSDQQKKQGTPKPTPNRSAGKRAAGNSAATVNKKAVPASTRSTTAKASTVKKSGNSAKQDLSVKKSSTSTTQTSSIKKSTNSPKQASSAKKNTSSASKSTASLKSSPVPNPPTEKEEFEKAAAVENPVDKISALKQFLEKFPNSSKKTEALGLIAVSRIHLGQDKLKSADTAGGLALLELAVSDLPVPVPEELFNGSIIKIPTELYWNGQRAVALEIAKLIEDSIEKNPGQLLGLASFYLAIENGSDAKRLAEIAIAIDPTLPAAYQTLGLGSRLNFDLDDAEKAYSKALELEPGSLQTLRSLAELKRAEGKPDEAADLYHRILEKDAANLPAETGLILSWFDAGKRADAEAEMAKSLEQNPNNVILLAGAAYWYAAHAEPDKAIEYSRSAIDREPRYIWSHIALARGLLAKKQPAAAEEVLLKARQYGNFPTLEYELASTRLMSGFFRDAADELEKSFVVKDGMIRTKLGGRVEREDSGFVGLISGERRASIFEPVAADDLETAARLKWLLEFDQAVGIAETNEDAAAKAADAFVGGDDPMKLHRELFAASSLLGKRIALAKVLEFTRAAIADADKAFDAPDPGAAIMASELYGSRSIALMQNQLIKVPEVPRATLSAILRGRIEEIAGWSLFYQNQNTEAIVRLRRAVSVMPPKSAWWRSSMWKLGAALQADGKDAEALDSYIKSYSIDKPDAARYATVEALYRKVNGNTEGLEKKIGVNPQAVVTKAADTSGSVAQQSSSPEPKTDASPTPDSSTAVKTVETTTVKAEPSVVPTQVPDATVAVTPTPDTLATPVPTSTPDTIEASPTPTPPTVEPSPTPASESLPAPKTETSPTPVPTPTSEPSPNQTVETTPTPLPTVVQAPVPEVSATPSPTPIPEAAIPVDKTPEAKPTPEPSKSDVAAIQSQTQLSKSNEGKPDNALVSSAVNKAKPLFEPVIITVPKPQVNRDKADSVAQKPTGEPASNKSDPTPPNETANGEKRPRIVDGKEVVTVEPQPVCTVSASQNTISILNNGGSLGILIQLDGAGDLKSIVATSDSPDDVQIKLEPDIAGVKGQAFYVIRSLTTKTGEFKVRFVAPCGSKEVGVTVR